MKDLVRESMKFVEAFGMKAEAEVEGAVGIFDSFAVAIGVGSGDDKMRCGCDGKVVAGADQGVREVSVGAGIEDAAKYGVVWGRDDRVGEIGVGEIMDFWVDSGGGNIVGGVSDDGLSGTKAENW